MRNPLKNFIPFFLTILVFTGGYTGTDRVFRRWLIPFPFEIFGVLTGLALVSFTFALLSLTHRRNPDEK